MILSPVKRTSVRVSLLFGLLLILTGFGLLRLEQRLPVVGRVYRETDCLLRAPMDAMVAELPVHEGSQVEPGQLLVALADDQSLLRAATLASEIARGEGELARLEAELAEIRLGSAAPEYVLAELRGPYLRDTLALRRELAETMGRLREQGAASQFDLVQRQLEVLLANQQLDEATRLAQNAQARVVVAEARHLVAVAGAKQSLAALRQELQTLEEVRARLRLCAPSSAEVSAVYARYVGVAVNRGDPVVKLSDPRAPVRIRALLSQHNADLVRPGLPVRMKSAVFEALLGEYVYGHVDIVVLHTDTPDAGIDVPPRYEVFIEIDSSPYPLPADSLVEAEIMVGQRTLAELFLHAIGFRRDFRREAAAP